MESENPNLCCKICNRKFFHETAFQFHEKWSHTFDDLNSELKKNTLIVEVEKDKENVATLAENTEDDLSDEVKLYCINILPNVSR